MRATNHTPPPCRWCGVAPEVRPRGFGILRPREWIAICPDIGCTSETDWKKSKEAALEEWARLNGRRE